jgi:hypothetical protein
MHRNIPDVLGHYHSPANINSGTIIPSRVTVKSRSRVEAELWSDEAVGLCCAVELPAMFFDATDLESLIEGDDVEIATDIPFEPSVTK